MAFTLPQFVSLCNIWHANAVPPVGAPDIADEPCQLCWDRSGSVPFMAGVVVQHLMLLRVHPGVDLRGRTSSTAQDTVEVPAGSGRFYTCHIVDDVALGFPNQYRQGMVALAAHPTPLP